MEKIKIPVGLTFLAKRKGTISVDELRWQMDRAMVEREEVKRREDAAGFVTRNLTLGGGDDNEGHLPPNQR